MMGQKPDAKLTPEIARELCQRTGSAAVLDGSIAQIGTQYLLTLKAVNCVSGESLASAEAQASDKNHVLDALGKTASEIRKKLGESLSTVQKFDTPLEQATTPSLEALQAYSLGRKSMTGKTDFPAAVSLFQRAIGLDPNFAMAYSSLSNAYWYLGETNLGAENASKAYRLRERVSDREKFYIECNYYWAAGDLEKARQAYELWAQTYPRDDVPPGYLGGIYGQMGQYDKALAEAREALRRELDERPKLCQPRHCVSQSESPGRGPGHGQRGSGEKPRFSPLHLNSTSLPFCRTMSREWHNRPPGLRASRD